MRRAVALLIVVTGHFADRSINLEAESSALLACQAETVRIRGKKTSRRPGCVNRYTYQMVLAKIVEYEQDEFLRRGKKTKGRERKEEAERINQRI